MRMAVRVWRCSSHLAPALNMCTLQRELNALDQGAVFTTDKNTSTPYTRGREQPGAGFDPAPPCEE